MNVDKIEKLEEVICLDKGEILTGHKTKRLTAPGENYGSLMLSVDLSVNTAKGKKEIKAVAKMIPPNEFIQKVFNTQVTFRNEIGFYKDIVPTLREFQQEQGMKKLVDFAPKYYGSRLNLQNDDSIVDSNAILLLENLKVANFKNLDRLEGFDLDVAKLVIRDLAHLHAVPLALKLKKPEVFENNIKKYLKPMEIPKDGAELYAQNMRRNLEQINDCKPFVERVMKKLMTPPKMDPREPFATIAHNDCWVNNTMVKYEGPVPFKNKIVDFQVCDYGSPAKDLLLLFFTSIKNHVLEQHYDHLLKYYHNIFTKVLEELKCDTAQFSFQAFLKEIDYEAQNSQFGHIIAMLVPILATRGKAKELSEFTPTTMAESVTQVTDLFKQKVSFVIKMFVKKNWI